MQCGRCDGYILEGRELEFYLKKMQKKKVRRHWKGSPGLCRNAHCVASPPNC